MLNKFKTLIPIVIPLFESFESIIYQGKGLCDYNYYVMAQICIAEAYRGKGLFQLLYKKHRETYQSTFYLCLTEISSSNSRSQRAHEKVAFKIIHTYTDAIDEWHIMCWDWT